MDYPWWQYSVLSESRGPYVILRINIGSVSWKVSNLTLKFFLKTPGTLFTCKKLIFVWQNMSSQGYYLNPLYAKQEFSLAVVFQYWLYQVAVIWGKTSSFYYYSCFFLLRSLRFFPLQNTILWVAYSNTCLIFSYSSQHWVLTDSVNGENLLLRW